LKTRRVWKLDRAVPARPSLSGSAFPATMIIQRGGIPNNGTGAHHDEVSFYLPTKQSSVTLSDRALSPDTAARKSPPA
jgi:hypothetical protein